MRLFVAVEASAAVRDEASRLVEGLKKASADVKWVEPENVHWTLHFFGETPEERVPDIAAALREAAEGLSAFPVKLGRAGAFPSTRSPRVAWLGLASGENELVGLAERVRRALASRGFEVEERPFKAHLTLGRVRGPEGAARLGKMLEDAQAREAMTVASVVLMQSKLGPEGPTYLPVERVGLSA